MVEPLVFDISGIKKCQRNRHPLLFLDRVYDVIPGERAAALKCFSYNEWFFPAHFDDEPNVPGFILIETLVQTFIMTFLSIDVHQGSKTNFLSAEKVRFKKKIIPGDVLRVEAVLRSFRRGIAAGGAIGYIGDNEACSAEFLVALPNEFLKFVPSMT